MTNDLLTVLGTATSEEKPDRTLLRSDALSFFSLSQLPCNIFINTWKLVRMLRRIPYPYSANVDKMVVSCQC
jgi:hypothetical protein